MRYFLVLIAFSLMCFTGYTQIDPVSRSGVAIDGYDVVAYFKNGKAVKGDPQFSAVFNQVTYHFSSEANKLAFEEAPAAYLPQFDGYCALAVSYGKKISVDPQTFKVSDNKLYLFYNGNTSKGKVNSLETWNKNEDRLLKKALSLWPDVKKTNYKPGAGL